MSENNDLWNSPIDHGDWFTMHCLRKSIGILRNMKDANVSLQIRSEEDILRKFYRKVTI